MKIFFGIDGGGTKTRIKAEREDGAILYEGETTSSNQFAVGKEKAVETVRSLIIAAITKTEDSGSIYGCLGLAGLGREEDRKPFCDMLSALLPCSSVRLTTDAEILLAGGLGNSPGIALIAGTGSIALMRLDDGCMIRSGGMGWRLGDEGSAWWIAHEAIRRTLRSLEGRDMETSMTDALLEHYHIEKPESFITLINDEKTEKSAIASGARIVTDAAISGDRLAIDILGKATDELKMLITSLLKRTKNRNTDIVFYGGVLEKDEYIRSDLAAKLRDVPVTILPKPKHSALDGALMIARSLQQRS